MAKIFKDYLNEYGLGENYIKPMYGNDVICDKQFPGHKFRPDFRIDSQKLIVEYDGFYHYTDPKVIMFDIKKAEILNQAGYKIVRIPYFVQLTSQNIIEEVFKIHGIDISNLDFTGVNYIDYPQGFISDDCHLPAEYCELGINRFDGDIVTYSCNPLLKEKIINPLFKSLGDKTRKLGHWKLVVPSRFEGYLD